MNDFLHFQQLDSTNTCLEQLMQRQNRAKADPLPDGMVVMTGFQTAGRGRKGNSWFSDNGKNLLMSILIYPNLPVADQFRVTEWISVAMADTIRQIVGLEAAVKWPNDIYLGNRKVAGILISHHWHGSKIGSSIIGIGLNVNQERFPDYLPTATSLLIGCGRQTDVHDTALLIREELQRIRQENPERLHRRYLDLLYQRNRPAQFRDLADGEVFKGVIEGVTPKGLLEMRCNGTLRHYELNGIAYL